VTQLNIISRHGEHFYSENDVEGTLGLSEEGVNEIVNIGALIRERFFCTQGEWHIEGLDGTYANDHSKLFTFARDTDRSLMSASAFHQGLWAGCDTEIAGFNTTNLDVSYEWTSNMASVMPVRTSALQNDILLNAYAQCPAYHTAVKKFLSSGEFESKVTEQATDLDKIKTCFGEDLITAMVSGDVDLPTLTGPFATLYSHIHDIASVHEDDLRKWTMAAAPALYDFAVMLHNQGVLVDVLSEDCEYKDQPDYLMLDLYVKTSWIEHSKMNLEDAPKYVAGNYLHELKQHLGSKIVTDNLGAMTTIAAHSFLSGLHLYQPTNKPYFDVTFFSTSYEIFLGIHEALGLSFSGAEPELPAFGHTLIFELLEDPLSHRVPQIRLTAMDKSSQSWETLDLSHLRTIISSEVAELGPEVVDYLDFFKHLETWSFDGPSKWCDACENHQSSACLEAVQDELTGESFQFTELSAKESSLSAQLKREKEIDKVVVGLVVVPSFFGALLICFIVDRIKQRFSKKD